MKYLVPGISVRGTKVKPKEKYELQQQKAKRKIENQKDSFLPGVRQGIDKNKAGDTKNKKSYKMRAIKKATLRFSNSRPQTKSLSS